MNFLKTLILSLGNSAEVPYGKLLNNVSIIFSREVKEMYSDSTRAIRNLEFAVKGCFPACPGPLFFPGVQVPG